MFIAIRERMEEREEGFTLIELLVVVIIIGILAAIAIPVFLRQRERAYAATVQSDLRNAAIGVETYFTQFQSYPSAAYFTSDILVDMKLPSDPTNVTLSWIDTGDAGTFCMNGDHLLLNGPGASVDFSYHSNLGGLSAEGVSC